MKVIVTGAEGFIGGAICEFLEKNSIEVIKFVRINSLSEKRLRTENTFEIDVTDRETLAFELKDIDALIHTAGLAHQFGKTSKAKFWDVNVLGTQNIAEFAISNKIKHFIHLSSVSVYGDIEAKKNNVAIDEDTLCNPTDYYAQSKLEAEKVCQKVFDGQDIYLTILRLATVIGEGDSGNVLRLIDLIDRRKFIWIGKGKNYKSLIHKEDVARTVLHLIKNKNCQTELFNLSGEAKSMFEIVTKIYESLNRKMLPIHIPVGLIIGLTNITYSLTKVEKIKQANKSIGKWLSDDNYSSNRIYNDYGFKSKVLIEEAIAREVVWYKSKK